MAALVISIMLGGRTVFPAASALASTEAPPAHGRSALLNAIANTPSDGSSPATPTPSEASHPARGLHRDQIWRSIAGHPAPSPEVLRAIAIAAGRSQMDFGLLLAVAWKESNFRPTASAPNSSARGLFQFTQATWREALAHHGESLGVRSTAANRDGLRFDPPMASLVAAETIRRNGEALASRLGRPISQAEAFLTHFLGLAGAERFLRAVAETPSRDVRQVIPIAFANNRARFPSGTGAIPVSAAYAHLIAILESRRSLYLQLLRLEHILFDGPVRGVEVAINAR